MSDRRVKDGSRQVTGGATNASSVPHRSLGRCLREMRHESGLSIGTAAGAIGRGAATLHRIETGASNVIVRKDDLHKLCMLYERKEMLPVLESLAAQGRTPSWLDEFAGQVNASFNAYVQMEAVATRLTVYRPDMVSGLFQTPDYARAVERVCFPSNSREDIERRVVLRRNRQRVLTRQYAPTPTHLVIDEAAICRRVGAPKVMAAQLRHLADLPANVGVQVLPFTRGLPCGVSTGPFTILDFRLDRAGAPVEPPVVFVESYAGEIYLERESTVSRYRTAFDTIRRVALGTAETKALLRQRAREYDRER